MTALVALLLAQCSQPCNPITAAPQSFSGSLSYVPACGLSASIDAYHGIATGGPIFPDATGNGLLLVGRRRDGVAQVTVESEVFVDGGVIFQVNAPFPCNFSAPPLFQCGPDGCSYGWAMHPDCSGNSDVFAGGLVDASGVAGHFSFRSAPANQLTIGGQLAKIPGALLEDGGHPLIADYPAGVVGSDSQDQTFFHYAGNHGSVTVADTSFMHAGLVLQLDNLEHPTQRHRAGFEADNGAYFQSHGLTRAQFPPAESLTVQTNHGQYLYFRESTLLYAFDTKHWYFRDGSKWVQLADQNQLDVLVTDLSLLAARIAVLEAR